MDAETRNLLNEGLAACRSGAFAKAEAILHGVLERAPDAADARHLLARIYHDRGEYEKAETFGRRAIALNGNVLLYHETLVKIPWQTIGAEAALDDFEKAAMARPRDFGAAYRLGVLLQALRRPKGAALHFQRASELAPKSVEVGSKLARNLARLGRQEEALKVIGEAFTLGAEKPEASVLVLQALPQGYFANPYSGPKNHAYSNTISQIPARRHTRGGDS